MPHTMGLKVVGTKHGRQGEHVVYFGDDTWSWVTQAIPCPVNYYTLRATWMKACQAVGQQDHRPYDLRHCSAQWATRRGFIREYQGDDVVDPLWCPTTGPTKAPQAQHRDTSQVYARGRIRTCTGIAPLGILSPLRLPISPPGRPG
jgi:hypothetical protein